MNYLAHLHLGGQRPEELLGSLYGDFVKGPLQGEFRPGIESGIQLHRSIDAFTDAHPLVGQALSRFTHTRRRYAGIVLDVFFYHCLARDWGHYADVPLERFTSGFYRVLGAEPQLPARLAAIAPHMAAHDWLGSYQDYSTLERVFNGIARRLSRPQELAGAMQDLDALYQPLSDDFQAFYPELQTYAAHALSR